MTDTLATTRSADTDDPGSGRLKRIVAFIRPYRARVAVMLVFMIMATAMANLYPFFIQFLIDEVFLNHDLGWLRTIVLGLVILALTQFVFSFVNGYLYTWLTARILLDMRLHLYRHLHRLTMRFFKENRVGDIISRLNSDMAQVQAVAMESLLTFLSAVLSLLVVTIILVVMDWRLFLISCVAVPAVVLLLRYFQPRIRILARQIRDQVAEITSFVLDALRGVKTVKTSGTANREMRRYLRHNKGLIRKVIRFQIISGLSSGLSGVLLTFSSAAVLWFGGRMMFAGEMTAGELMAFELFQIRLFGPVRSLVELYLKLQKAKASVDRVFEFLEQTPEAGDRPGARRLSPVKGEVVFENVTFSYDAGSPILKEISFRIPSGSRMAIVGTSGAGKTTVADLLFRLYLPDSGRITIDGHDLSELRMKPLLRQMALVPQEIFLFHGTVEENICYGSRRVSREDVLEAVASAHLAPFIESLPDGLSTIVGERGLRFSGGQAQRIALARAILRQPKILVLDEAMAALDWLSDTHVHLALERLMEGRTTILISHRMSMMEEMDHIVVLDGCAVAERGTHETLMEAGGLYRRLFDHARHQRTAADGVRLNPGRGPTLEGAGG